MTIINKTSFLCGIGGSGMSALAYLLLQQGHRVCGSDRSHDCGESPEKFSQLEKSGVHLFPQDGSGLTADVDELIVSSAVEDTIPDVKSARAHHVPIRKRADILAGLFNKAKIGIGVGGTSGKSTVTGMVSVICHRAGVDPMVMNGGIMNDFAGEDSLGNAVAGEGDVFVTELDESDGSIALFRPAIAILTNITLDHKSMTELRALFGDYVAAATQGAVINCDDEEAAKMLEIHPQTVTYGIDNPEADLKADISGDGVVIVKDGIRGEQAKLTLRVPGKHNISNALAALAAAGLAGVPLQDAVQALNHFTGIRRRFDIIGTAAGVTVIDDFAHNPDKIAATLATLKEATGRVMVIFQPHGFGPTRMMKNELVSSFVEGLGVDDLLLMPEIYYAGGSAAKDISSRDIVAAVDNAGTRALFLESRAAIQSFVHQNAVSGDRIIVMGARDDTLHDFAEDILSGFKDNRAIA